MVFQWIIIYYYIVSILADIGTSGWKTMATTNRVDPKPPCF